MSLEQATPRDLKQFKQEMLDHHRGLLRSEHWHGGAEQNGVKSWILHPDDGTISIVRAESVVHRSAGDLFRYLVTDIAQTCTEWNDAMYYAATLKNLGNGFDWATVRAEGHIVADREDLFFRWSGQHDDGHYYELSRGYGEEVLPVNKKITRYAVRSDMHFASKEFIPISDTSCRYITIWHYDPAGWLSKLIPKKTFGKLILKNLVHEHRKLRSIFQGLKGG